MVKPPSSIRILGKRYSVSEGAGENRMGRAEHKHCSIGYDRDQDVQQLRDTVLHEVIHAIEFSVGMNLKENQVHALACGLLQVLRENPAFVRWLTSQR